MNIDTIMNPRTAPSPIESKGAMLATLTVAETIRELREVPSGELYARLMSRISYSAYEGIIGTLKNAGLVSESAFLLKWTGPGLENQR